MNPIDTYPEPHRQYHSYGIRYWDGTAWQYLTSQFIQGTGHTPSWENNDYRAWTTTSLLSAMFQAQGWAVKLQRGIHVVEFNEPKEIWSTHPSNRHITLEDKPDEGNN